VRQLRHPSVDMLAARDAVQLDLDDERAFVADNEVFQNAARYSARNGEQSHVKVLANAWRPGESASSESGAERVGSPSGLARAARTGRVGSPVVRAPTTAVAAAREGAAKQGTPGGTREA
jgi:hypothetical protein